MWQASTANGPGGTAAGPEAARTQGVSDVDGHSRRQRQPPLADPMREPPRYAPRQDAGADSRPRCQSTPGAEEALRLDDHPRADGVVGRLVDEDEGPRGAVAQVGVEGERLGRPQAHAPDVVERELAAVRRASQGLEVDAVLDGVDDRARAVGRVLDRVAPA